MAGLPLAVGDTATRSLTLTREHVEKYAEISGDRNPLHFDEDFAAATKFGRLVVQGGLTTGLLHALVAMDMPGPGTVFLSQDWNFTAPVYIGDTITAHAEVAEVHGTKPVCRLRVRVMRRRERDGGGPRPGDDGGAEGGGGEAVAGGSGRDLAGSDAGELVLEGEAWCYTFRGP